MRTTIIIPTYRRPDVLPIALDSAINQTVPIHSILLGDDSKDDKTQEVIRAYQSQYPELSIQTFHHRPSLGQARNVHDLMQRVTSEYTLLLHDDDILAPTCVAHLEEAFVRHPEIIAAFGDALTINDDGSPVAGSRAFNRDYFKSKEREGLVSAKEAAYLQMLPNDAYLIKTSVAQRVGYVSSTHFGTSVDLAFALELAKLKDAQHCYVHKVMNSYRLSAQAVSNNNDGTYYFVIHILERQPQVLDEIPLLKKHLPNLLPQAVMTAIKKGDTKRARSWSQSPYYRESLFTPGGVKRNLLILKQMVTGG